MVHRAPGINDAESKLYKDFDKNGRTSAVESNKAALTGVKNLQTVPYKYESPFVGVRDRFPEKYADHHRSNSAKRPGSELNASGNIFVPGGTGQ